MENYIGKICPFCKTDIKEGDAVKVCPSCGIPHHEACWEENKGCTTFGCSEQHYEEQHTNPTDVCVKCGTPLGDGQVFCHKCGTPKGGAKKNICGKCGAELQDGQEFCPKCGQKAGLGVDANVSSAINQYNAGVNKANEQKKKKPVKIIVAAVIVLAVIVAAATLLPKLFKSVDAYLAEGNYKKAYSVAKGDEKEEVRKENLIAYLSSGIPENLKDPGSFALRDAWYDQTKQRVVLHIAGANSYGATVTSYYYFTYDDEDKEWSLYCSLSDLDEEKIYSWDDTSDMIEKLLYNAARKEVREIISRSSLKLDKDAVKNINHLFEEDILDDVKLLDID